ncbi:DNA-binding SARP family transcriptional activator [Pseudarthrobacter defluvii]|uniref:DNA-binding SARP family transcriptional activator n=1 Tax=Pseudarthrobacter defluvii TaxID=410837 RepID=A0ABT9UMJ5_9MICC|nr:bacterial transcriptional activator domain-containing protein [Pseudarthrobacter defluvii]MDQ0120871.1 DNA-binding SARP family transcriptional activator [Pseudarthrobacter defluvii]
MTEALMQEWRLSLLGAWRLQRGNSTVRVPSREQRLLACLGLLGCRNRSFLAGLLWPKSSDSQAAGNLRTSVWSIAHSYPQLLHLGPDTLELEESVCVDVATLQQQISGIHEQPNSRFPDSYLDQLSRAELLPGWYDDWVVFEQERLRQLRLSALELMAQRYLTSNAPGKAVIASLSAVAIEPLRESAHLLLVQAHLASGNRAAAVRAYDMFADRLHAELGVHPSTRLTQLLTAFHPL